MRGEKTPKLWVKNWSEAVAFGTEFVEGHGFGAEAEIHSDGSVQTAAVLEELRKIQI